MRVGFRLGPVFASCRPGALPRGILGVLMLPLYIPALLIMALAVVVWLLTAAVWLVVWAIKALTWLIVKPLNGLVIWTARSLGGIVKAIWWLCAAPFRLLIGWPVKAWRRHRNHARVEDAFAQPPAGPRVAA